MAAPGNFGVYKFGLTAGSGVNREDLLDQITNVDPWDTPWVTQAPKVQANHVYHEWLKDTLQSLATTGAQATAVEGDDYAYSGSSTPTREFNITMILRKDIGVSETQRAVNPAGFKDAYAYEIQKGVKELAVKLEKMLFQANTTATGDSASGRVMKNFQNFIITNTARAGLKGTSPTSADATHDGTLQAADFNELLNVIYSAGGNPEQVYVSPRVKRQISNFTVNSSNRNIAAVDKRLVSAIDFYDSDFGLIQIVLDRWVPESTNPANTVTASASATNTGGQMFFLQRSVNRLAWLRPMQHYLVGKRGDSVAGLVVGEVTLEVLNEKANGRMLSVSNVGVGV